MNSTTKFLTLFAGLFLAVSAWAGGPKSGPLDGILAARAFSEKDATEAVLPCATPNAVPTNPTCTVAGSIQISMVGGAGGTQYIYILTGPMNLSSGGFSAAASYTFSGLAAGTYVATVYSTDMTCSQPAANLTITLTAAPTVSLAASSTPTACMGSAVGTITASASGGTGAIQYSLAGPVNVAFQASGAFSSLPAGSYTVTAKDANNCTATMAKSVGTTQPSAVAVVLSSQTNAACFGGTGDATFSASGGFGGPYSYALSNAATNQTGFFTGLASSPTGTTFSVVATDVAGCGFPQTAVSITSPAQISITAASITNVNCNGGATGIVDLTVSGGPSGVYGYAWSGAGSGGDPRTALAAGSYMVTVTSGACSNSATFMVGTSSAILVVAATPVGVTHVTCFGGTNGAVNITATGGAGGYTYDWAHIAGPSNPEDLTSVGAGTYTVTVKDAANCTTTASFSVTQPIAPLAAAPVVTNNACSSGSSGAIALLANTSGGTAPYNFDWADVPGATNAADRTSLAAATYAVTITDAKGCSISQPVAVTAPALLTIAATAAPTVLACFGYSNATISASSTGGTGAKSYELSASSFATQTNGTGFFSGLAARNYTVKVTDASLCTATMAVVISQPANLSIALVSSTNSTCFGGSNGMATASAAGGTGTRTFSISPGGASNFTGVFGGLAAGNYTISVTDANACAGATVGVTIGQPVAFLVGLAQTSSVKCHGDADGALQATVISGATGPFSYALSNGTTNASGTFSGLAAGGYWVEVTAANGCTADAPAFPALTYVTEPLDLAATTTQSNATCNGLSNGSVTIAATGGITPYQFSKDNGATFQAGATFSSLAAGPYSIVVKDANGCTESPAVPVNISQPSVLTATVTAVDVTCNGLNDGKILIYPSGGTAPFEFSNSGGMIWTSPGNNLVGANTHVFTLAPGSYDVLVRDVNGCVSPIYVADIFQPDPLAATGTVANVTCNGSANGQIQMIPTGGTGPFSYSKAGLGGAVTNATGLFSGLAPSVGYMVTTTDARGCSTVNAFSITEQPVLTVTATPTAPMCTGGSNGSISASAAGGNGNFSYSLYQGAMLVAPPNATGAFSALPSGTYQVVVSDNKNCQAQASVVVTNPMAVNAIGSQTGAPGTAGNLTIVFSGSNAPFTATQVDLMGAAVPGGFSYTGAGPAVFNNAALGVYNFKTKNMNNCAGPDVVVNITAGFVPLSAGAPTKTDATCAGTSDGTITVTPSGGAGGYSYSKNNGGAFQASNVFTGLAGGMTYQIVVKDAVNISTAAIAVTVNAPTAITIPLATISSPACSGGATGSITFGAAVSGGTPSYSFFWSNGTLASNLVGVPAGNYGFVVTDSKGCTATAGYTVGAAGSPLTVPMPIATNVLCTGAATGALTLSPSGGTMPYSFAWTGPSGFSSSSQNPSSLVAGTYLVTVTATGGCTATASKAITQPATALSASAVPTAINCVNATGSIALTVAGGTGAKTFSWTGPSGFTSILQNLTSLAAGAYNVTVTDANGCTATATATVANTNNVSGVLTTTDTGCSGLSDGTLTAVGFGGTSPYQFSLSGGAFTALAASHTFTGLSAGTYTVVTKDAAGCSSSGTAAVGSASFFTPSATVTNAACAGASNGQIVATVAAPFANPALYIYALNGGGFQASNTFAGLAAATYQVTVKRNTPTGCAVNVMATVTQPSAVAATISATVPAGCFGGSTGSATAAGSGGPTGTSYNYLWPATAASQTTAMATGLVQGSYVVTVTSSIGSCSATATATIGQPAAALSAVATVTQVSCNGGSTGAVLITATGGTGLFQYSQSFGAGGSFGAGNLFTGFSAQTFAAGKFGVVDANGCYFSFSTITITQPTVLAVATTPVATGCNGSTGSVSVNGLTATGGTAPFSYAWSNGGTGTSIAGLAAGTFTVTATDSKGCTATSSSMVTTSGAGVGSATIQSVLPVTCGNNGQILLNLTGCVSSVQWFMGAMPISVGAITNPITNLAPGVLYNYKINGGAASANIIVPNSTMTVAGFAVEDNTMTSVSLSWTPKPNVIGYQVQHKTCAGAAWTTSAVIAGTAYTVSGLTANACYQFEVRFIANSAGGQCTGAWTATSPVQTTTPAAFNPPISTASAVMSNSAATITWQQVAATAPTITNVILRYRTLLPTGAYTTLVLAPGDLLRVLSGLTPGRTYQFNVRNQYAAGLSAWSPNKQFSLPTLLSGSSPDSFVKSDDAAFDQFSEAEAVQNANDRSAEKGASDEKGQIIGLQLAPNPATENLWIDLIRLAQNRPVTVQVRSLEGRLALRQILQSPNAHEAIDLDVTGLAPGLYFVEILQDGQRKTAKFIRQ